MELEWRVKHFADIVCFLQAYEAVRSEIWCFVLCSNLQITRHDVFFEEVFEKTTYTGFEPGSIQQLTNSDFSELFAY